MSQFKFGQRVKAWAARGGAWELPTLLVAMGVYLGVFTVVRLTLSTSLNHDDAEQAIFTQRLAWSYGPLQPPLYTWLLLAAQRATGLAPAVRIIFNYLLWLLTLGLYYRSARRILGDAPQAALASLALLSLYRVGWSMHENLTHTALLMALCAATLLAFLRLIDRGRVVDYLLLGGLLGLGTLSKYNFLGLPVCLFGAAGLQSAMRRRLLRPAALLSLAVGVAVVLPYVLWTLGSEHDLGPVYRKIVDARAGEGWLAQVRGGLASIPMALVAFLSPLLVVATIVAPGLWRPWQGPDPPAADPAGPDLTRLLRDMLLLAVLVLCLGVVAVGVRRYPERWMYPLLTFAPIYLVARIRRARPSALRMRVFLASLILFPLGVLAVRTAHLVLGPPLCGWPCRDRTPFDQLAHRLARAGFTGGTIVTSDHNLAGNLRMRFPGSRVFWTERPFFEPPPRVERGQCLIVWNVDTDGPHPPPSTPEYSGLTGDGASLQAWVQRASIPWRLPFHGTRDPVTTWAYLLIPQGAGRCT